jgi:hypothetical protein
MWLAILLVAITKLNSDNIEPLKSWGHVRGDAMPGIKSEPVINKASRTSIIR